MSTSAESVAATPIAASADARPVPEGFRPHSEGQASILVPLGNTAFLNPIQEYNRDLSVCVIEHWARVRSKEMQDKFETGWRKRQEKGGKGGKKRKREQQQQQSTTESASTVAEQPEAPLAPPAFTEPRFTILEALSATGLRSIRYAKEIKQAGIVLANDFSPSACDAMRQNVEFNGVGAVEVEAGSKLESAADASETTVEGGAESSQPTAADASRRSFQARGLRGRRFAKSGVIVNQGDAAALLYQHRTDADRVDVVDLDPYGTAAPFIDGAVQAVSDGGLLCVTCTDLAVLAGGSYPEKCYSNYGGVGTRTEYGHEAALRLVLSSLSTAAARYGRYIEPVLSLSIDFYVRLFVRVHTGQAEVKHVASKTGLVYACTYCHAHHSQPFGRHAPKTLDDGRVLDDFKFASGPPCPERCVHCGSNHLVAGPMWLGPLHDPTFLDGMLGKLAEGEGQRFKTYPRIRGMVTVAKDESTDLFYFSPPKMASHFKAQSPSLLEYASALFNAGYRVTRSHAQPGSLKTDAPAQFIHDVLREYTKDKPVRRDKIPETSPAHKLLDKTQENTVSFEPHESAKLLTAKQEIVRYQENPTANWGPAARAKNVKSKVSTAASTGAAEPQQVVEHLTAAADEPPAEKRQKTDAAKGSSEQEDLEAMMNEQA